MNVNIDFYFDVKNKVSFSAMKKNQFFGIERVVLNKFRPNINKFNTNSDFQNWCLEKIQNEYLNKDYTGRRYYSKPKRESMLKVWFDYCLTHFCDNAVKLLIIDGISKNLKNNNDNLPPVFNKEILEHTIAEIEERVEKNSNYNAAFEKLYQNKLREPYISILDNNTGWIIIPGKNNDNENFNENVNKLKILSHQNWCTKVDAELFLSNGDFHIYINNGKTKLGINYNGDTIGAIQGEKNDGSIPDSYKNIVKKHLNDYNNAKYKKIISNRLEKLKDYFQKLFKTIINFF